MAQKDFEKYRNGCPQASKAQRGKIPKFWKKVEIHRHPEYAPEKTADNLPVGETLIWGRYKIWRFRVVRSTCSFYAYVGLPIWHPLAWFHYERIELSPHGGFTFSGFLDPDNKKIKWYGWDYAHLFDRLVPGPQEMVEIKKLPGWPERFPSFTVDGHNWKLGEVLKEVIEMITEFRTRTWELIFKATLSAMADKFFWIPDQIIKKILKRKK